MSVHRSYGAMSTGIVCTLINIKILSSCQAQRMVEFDFQGNCRHESISP